MFIPVESSTSSYIGLLTSFVCVFSFNISLLLNAVKNVQTDISLPNFMNCLEVELSQAEPQIENLFLDTKLVNNIRTG